jgi:RNA polymerase sigma-70 factor (ECF subfamily)
VFESVEAADPDVPDETGLFAEREYRQLLARRAMELMEAEFEANTWKACWESVVSDRPAAEIAVELGMTVNAVYLAKSRVLRRLRADLDGLWD